MMHQIMRKAAHFIYIFGSRLFDLIVLSVLFFLGINFAMVQGTRTQVQQVEEVATPVDAVLVLGASVQWLQLSPILQDRVETAIQMYQRGKTKKIIISWDNGKKYYNEVDAMYSYCVNRGIPAKDIIVDMYGYSTYESIIHVRTLPGINTVGVVTQNFHLPRALFIAQSIGIQAIGIVSDRASYYNSQKYELRESFARIKAFFQVIRWYMH